MIHQKNVVAQGSAQFASDLYKQMAKHGENLFFSPWSISTALAMTYEGACGKTAEEIAATAHLPVDDTVRQNLFQTLIGRINQAGAQLNTSNVFWADQNYQFLQEYVAILQQVYDADATNVDFVNNKEAARQQINARIEADTNNRIKELLKENNLDRFTKALLTNTVYFKGDWETKFDEEQTKEDDFTLSNGKTVKTDMMNHDGRFRYTETENAQIVVLPYKTGGLVMTVALPRSDISNLEKLSFTDLAELRDSATQRDVDVYLPKFKFDSRTYLNQILTAMGMAIPFTEGQADFSGMDGSRELYIGSIIHQAFVEVNEEGTEAAAATAVVISREMSILPQHKIEFRADHPFIFTIDDETSGLTLFAGKVENPA